METLLKDLSIYKKCLIMLSAEKLPLVVEINENLDKIEKIEKEAKEAAEKVREAYYMLEEGEEGKRVYKKFIFNVKRLPGEMVMLEVERDKDGNPVESKGKVLLPTQEERPLVGEESREAVEFEMEKILNKVHNFEPTPILKSDLKKYLQIRFEKTGTAFDGKIILPLEGIILV